MGIEPISATVLSEVAKESIKETGKEVAKGVKEGVKEGTENISKETKDKYLQKDTSPVNEVSENIPNELKEISREVEELEKEIDHNPEGIAENAEKVKVDLKSIEGKLKDFVQGFKENMANKVSIGEHADHIIDKGLDIGKDINTYTTEINKRLNEAGIDIDKILNEMNSSQNFSDIDDTELDESDFGGE